MFLSQEETWWKMERQMFYRTVHSATNIIGNSSRSRSFEQLPIFIFTKYYNHLFTPFWKNRQIVFFNRSGPSHVTRNSFNFLKAFGVNILHRIFRSSDSWDMIKRKLQNLMCPTTTGATEAWPRMQYLIKTYRAFRIFWKTSVDINRKNFMLNHLRIQSMSLDKTNVYRKKRASTYCWNDDDTPN